MKRRNFLTKLIAACAAPMALVVCKEKVPASKIEELNKAFEAIEKHDIKPETIFVSEGWQSEAQVRREFGFDDAELHAVIVEEINKEILRAVSISGK